MPASELSFQTLSLTLNSGSTIRADFTYTYSGFFPKNIDFVYYLNGSVLDNLFITWTITNTDGVGVGRADFSRSSEVTASLFSQASTQTHFIVYYDPADSIGPFTSSTVTTVFTLSDSNNVTITKPVTIVSISDYKSIILPPVGICKGTLYHFKILTATAPYTLQIFPRLVVSPPIPPLVTNLYTTSLTFDSQIEGTPGAFTFDSTTTLNTLTLVSDGANWWILNRYFGTITPDTADELPGTITSETTETVCFRKISTASTNIAIYPMSYSNLKYIFLQNDNAETGITFTIYFPTGKALETVTGANYKKILLSVSAGAIAALIITYSNDTYYIVSAINNPAIDTAASFDDTPVSISSTVNYLLNGTFYYVPYLSNLNSSKSTLVIIKAGGAQKVKSLTSLVVFQLTSTANPYTTPIQLATNKVIWFIVIQVSTTQYYLPVSYYIPT